MCDPVAGDNGRFYIDEKAAAILRDELVPLADVITPNLFEFEFLCGKSITSEADVIHAMKSLLEKYSKLSFVVLTSFEETISNNTTLKLYGTVRHTNNNNSDKDHSNYSKTSICKTFCISFPKKKVEFSGTGDTFSALLLGWYLRFSTLDNETRAVSSCEYALNTIQLILEQTLNQKETLSMSLNGQYELGLVTAHDAIIQPTIRFKANWIDD